MTLEKEKFNSILQVIRKHYPDDEVVPLYKSLVLSNTNVEKVLNQGELSTASGFIEKVEAKLVELTGAKHVVALNSGTSALHMSLIAIGVQPNDFVITQPLTFVATGNSILYSGATPLFVDVERESLGIDPELLDAFLKEEAEVRNGTTFHKKTGRRISACVPMHTLGFSSRIDEIVAVCKRYSIPVVEDAAESFGSYYKGQATGTFGELGCLSFNGNKIVTAGAGGAVLCKSKAQADRIKHLSTTAKTQHAYEFNHNALGFNNRMAGINAALLLDQLEHFSEVREAKRQLAHRFQNDFKALNIEVLLERENGESNFWLNTVKFDNLEQRTQFLEYANSNGVLCRPIWKLLSELPHFADAVCTRLENAKHFSETLVSIPSYVTADMLAPSK